MSREEEDSVAEFEMFDYVKMQNEMYMNSLDTGPSSPVTVYGDDNEKKILSFWYDEEDKALVEDALSNSGGAFIKGYSKSETARDGVQIQSGEYKHLGYGNHSTIHLIRIIALTYLGITLQQLEQDGWYIVPKNDNHLDLHRDNIVIGRDIHEWGEKYRNEMSLESAKHYFTKENN